MLARAWPSLAFENGSARNFEDVVARPILRFSRLPLDLPIVALGVVPGINPAHVLAATLDRLLFSGQTLADHPDAPRFTFNAAHVATGTSWRFSKPYMGTYRVGLIRNPTVRVADAVAASAAFPPIVSPFVLRTSPEAFVQTPGADLYTRTELRERALLLDGGAYDNLGVQTLSERVETLLVSDGGGNLGIDTGRWKFALRSIQLRRVLDMSVEQGRDLRRSALVRRARAREFTLALWRTTSDPTGFTARTPFTVSEGWRAYLSTRKTRMWTPGAIARDALVDWGYLASDLALRSYVFSGAQEPTSLPMGTDFTQPPPTDERVGGQPRDEDEREPG